MGRRKRNEICLIGCCPSSGSTVLADVLDAQPISMCGPELCLFSNQSIYSKKPENCIQSFDICPAPYKVRNRPYFHNLNYFDMDKKSLKKQLLKVGVDQLIQNLANDHFFSRNKPGGIFFEKTPENNHYARNYLSHFSNGYYLFMVRNPLFVYNSMLKRGFSKKSSLLNWFIEAYLFIALKKDKRVLSIKYEDFVKNPFKTSESILKKLNPSLVLSETEIKNNYLNDKHRIDAIKRPESWSIENNKAIINGNKKEIDEEIKRQFSLVKNLKIHDKFAARLKFKSLTFMEIIEYFGYHTELSDLFQEYKFEDRSFAKIDWIKALKSLRYNNFNLLDSAIIAHPAQVI